ncbi:Viridiflorene synthase [Camellia lanceoleosa]|uniref:Viridiflorene synthase n=1 Tax=Camellia lanceoleosa TaxID=1840588 RepID=A0ACC0FJV7_9ERIC|nr:Viridiflorene synthase [Camellia lanceoleosa]
MASSQVGDMVNGNAEPTRHLAKFPPSLWGDRFTSFTLDKQLWNKYGNEIEVLKELVRSMVVAGGRKAAEQMNLINVLKRLGVSYHFEKEIEEQLEQLFANFEDNEDYDLFTIALHFRIFRQHGYKMSCDVFNKFRDSNGEFKETVSNDVKGMLSLYEATYLKIRGEGFLDEAHAFTIAQLESLVGGPHLSSDLSEQVMHTLMQSIHRGFPRLEAKHFIAFYEQDASRNETLLRLAKLDFNQLQLSHREELCHISRMAPAKKMHRLPPPKRALLEPYSPSTDTCTPYPKGLAADGFEPIGPSLSQINVLSGSETIAPSSSQTNAPHGFEIYEASPSETHAPSPQSQTSGAGKCRDQQLEKQQQKELPTIMETSSIFQSLRHSMHSKFSSRIGFLIFMLLLDLLIVIVSLLAGWNFIMGFEVLWDVLLSCGTLNDMVTTSQYYCEDQRRFMEVYQLVCGCWLLAVLEVY